MMLLHRLNAIHITEKSYYGQRSQNNPVG
jgi:hypothetical protein